MANKKTQELELYSNDAEVVNETPKQEAEKKKMSKKQKAVITAAIVAAAAVGGVVAAETMGITNFIPDKNTDNPNTPDNPDTPDIPDNPNTPDNPSEPDNPNTPDNPDKPDTPDTPDNPNTPIVPDEPDNPDNPNDSGNNKPEEPDINDTSEYGKFLTDLYNSKYVDAYSSENFKLYNQSLKKSLKEQSYYLDSSENSYSNYYEMLKEIGKNDLNSAKSYYQKINKDVENMLNTYSSTSYGDAPNGYINDNYNSYNTTMQQYWKTSLKVTYDDIYNIVYSKKPNADFMNSEIKIGTELDLFDLLPEDVQEWRYSYWGYGSESEYKNELKQQIVRVGLLEDAVDNLPKVGVITAYKVWAYGLQNATEEEKDDLEFIINSKTLNTIDYVRDSGDLAHYNKAFAPVGDFLNDVIDLHNHTFKDPNKSLESYYTAESKKLIKDKIKNIEAQYNKLKDKNYLDSIESSARALSDDVTYDYVYYVTEIYNFYKDHILTNNYIQEIQKENSTMVDFRTLAESEASFLTRPAGTKVVKASKLNENGSVYILKMMEDKNATLYQLNVNGKIFESDAEDVKAVGGMPVSFTKQGDYVVKSRTGKETVNGVEYSTWSYPQNFTLATEQQMFYQAVNKNIDDFMETIKKRHQTKTEIKEIENVNYKNNNFEINAKTKQNKFANINVDLSKHYIDENAKDLFGIACASASLLKAYIDGAKINITENETLKPSEENEYTAEKNNEKCM